MTRLLTAILTTVTALAMAARATAADQNQQEDLQQLCALSSDKWFVANASNAALISARDGSARNSKDTTKDINALFNNFPMGFVSCLNANQDCSHLSCACRRMATLVDLATSKEQLYAICIDNDKCNADQQVKCAANGTTIANALNDNSTNNSPSDAATAGSNSLAMPMWVLCVIVAGAVVVFVGAIMVFRLNRKKKALEAMYVDLETPFPPKDKSRQYCPQENGNRDSTSAVGSTPTASTLASPPDNISHQDSVPYEDRQINQKLARAFELHGDDSVFGLTTMDMTSGHGRLFSPASEAYSMQSQSFSEGFSALDTMSEHSQLPMFSPKSECWSEDEVVTTSSFTSSCFTDNSAVDITSFDMKSQEF